MSLRPAALIIVLLLATAVPAAGQAEADRVSAEGRVHLTSDDARPLLDLNRTVFDLAAQSATLTLVDDWTDVYQDPAGGNVWVADESHDVETVTLRNLRAQSLLSDPDALLLVPQVGVGYHVDARADGSLDVTGANDQVLERQHFETENAVGVESPHTYQYRAGTDLAATVRGEARYTLQGDFTLYLWGTTFGVTGDNGTQSHRTGSYETRSGMDAALGVVVRQHNVYALLEVRDGTLTASGSDGALYGASLTLEVDGVALFSDADGAISSSDGRHVLSGGVVVEDGAYALSRDGGNVRVAVRDEPSSIRGATVTTEPATPWPLGLGFGAAGLLLLAAGVVHARPAAVAGMAQTRYRRISADPVRRMSWRELRADGHRRLGCRAEVRGEHRRVLWHLDRALRIEPDNPRTAVMRGTTLRRLGRHEEAVESHKHAHEWLDILDPDRDDVAHNAYEAARACALSGRVLDTFHWLGIAVQADPDLAPELSMEPDFASVADTREFRSLVRGARSCGRRDRPGPSDVRGRSGGHCDA